MLCWVCLQWSRPFLGQFGSRNFSPEGWPIPLCNTTILVPFCWYKYAKVSSILIKAKYYSFIEWVSLVFPAEGKRARKTVSNWEKRRENCVYTIARDSRKTLTHVAARSLKVYTCLGRKSIPFHAQKLIKTNIDVSRQRGVAERAHEL